jgi:nifR3 family TIM-barrel protein
MGKHLPILMKTTLSIGSLALKNNLLLAPMAGITNLPVRLMARRYGASLCFTEMVSVNGLVRDGKKSFELLKSTPVDRPLGIQLFGDTPETMADGARLVEEFADLIDINMGCPVRKVVNSGAGSALLREPDKVAAIIRAVRKVTRLPLTIKIRSGWSGSDDNYMEIGRIASEEGCDAITLHPRSRSQMFEGEATWEKIARLKESLGIPVIGSGDLFSAAAVVEMLDKTGCDGVMIARGGLGNPWIFRESLALLADLPVTPPTVAERLEIALEHIATLRDLTGDTAAAREIRPHIAWYVRGIPGAARFRAEINRITTCWAMEEALRSFLGAQPGANDQTAQ